MNIFIPSCHRPHMITAHRLFEKVDVRYKIVLHNKSERSYYLMNKSIDPDSIIVADIPFGMSAMRRFIYDLVSQNEWFLMMDDNICMINGVQGELYNHDELDVKNDKKLKREFDRDMPILRFLEVCQKMIQKADAENIYHIGFATTANFFFRPKKYRTVGYVIGKMTLTKESDLNWDPNLLAMDDYGYTAQNLLRYGKVLINNFINPVKRHYAEGGIGNYAQRLESKIKDCEYLMTTYPGLFRYNEKVGCHPKAELLLRLNNEEQVNGWQRTMQGGGVVVK